MESKPTEQDIKRRSSLFAAPLHFWKKLNIRNKAIIRTDSVKRKGSDYHALAPQTGLEPVTPRLTVCCSLISIIFHASINFQKWLKTRGFWVSCKINNIYYSPYVYRFCSQFCSQKNFIVLKAEPTTIRKIHLCSYIIKKIINLLSNPLEITGTPSDLLKRYCVPVTTTS